MAEELAELVARPRILPPGVREQRMIVPWETCGEWYRERNICNYRPFNHAIGAKYRDVMAAGKWDYIGDSIRFDVDGVLLDGQKRLWAAWKAQRDLDTLVVVDLPRESVRSMDVGQKRVAANYLSHLGYKNTSTLANAAAWLITWRKDRLKTSEDHPLALIRGMPNEQVADIVRAEPGIADSVSWVKSRKCLTGFLRPGLGAFLHYAFGLHDPMARNLFMEGLDTGADLKRDTGVWRLRRRLSGEDSDAADNRAHHRAKAGKLPDMDIAALTIKAWHYHLSGRKCGLLRWAPELGEAFPPLPQYAPRATAMILEA